MFLVFFFFFFHLFFPDFVQTSFLSYLLILLSYLLIFELIHLLRALPLNNLKFPWIKSHITQFKSHISQFKSYVSQFNPHSSQFKSHLTQFKSHITQFNTYLSQVNSYLSKLNSHITQLKSHISDCQTDTCNFLWFTSFMSFFILVKKTINLINSGTWKRMLHPTSAFILNMFEDFLSWIR